MKPRRKRSKKAASGWNREKAITLKAKELEKMNTLRSLRSQRSQLS